MTKIDYLYGGDLVGKGQRPAVYPRGRACAAEGCTTTLSVYNPATACYRHDRARLFKTFPLSVTPWVSDLRG